MIYKVSKIYKKTKQANKYIFSYFFFQLNHIFQNLSGFRYIESMTFQKHSDFVYKFTHFSVINIQE